MKQPAHAPSRQEDSAPLIDLRSHSGALNGEFLEGLSRNPKRLPCKFLYDAEGSRLFERICSLPEYYPTRTEGTILSTYARDIASEIGKNAFLIELGSGSSAKTEILLDSLKEPAGYVPIDISETQLEMSAYRLREAYPWLGVFPICADYTESLTLPSVCKASRDPRTLFFPGSTIGNFEPEEAKGFLTKLHQTCGPDGFLLIGADLKKDRRILEAAYDDRAGITAQFNKNVLLRANRELGAEFDPSTFEHEARYNETRGRIEMHLVSTLSQEIRVNGSSVRFGRDESVVTEHSYKYTIREFQELVESAGYRRIRCWTDPKEYFSVHLFAL